MKSQKVMFQKSQTAHREPPRKAAYSKHSIAIHSNYVTAVLAIVRTELCARDREASSLCDYWKMTCDFTFFFFWLKQT